MNVSLDQAIEIHAKVLRHRFGDQAPMLAQEKAGHCSASGDPEGEIVWLRVAAVAEAQRRRATSDQTASTSPNGKRLKEAIGRAYRARAGE
jgi:hypothetical protein